MDAHSHTKDNHIRTFWEKATILHAESIRPADQPMPTRLARHAYDLHQLMQSSIGQAALAERGGLAPQPE